MEPRADAATAPPGTWGTGPDPAGLPPLAERLKALRVLQAVARHGSAARAAEAIHLSQPAVTRAVLELERTCQTPLFVRAARGMVPTPAGERVAQRAGTVFLLLACGASEALTATPGEARRPVLPERVAAAVSIGSLKALTAVALPGTRRRIGTVVRALSEPAPELQRFLQACVAAAPGAGERAP